jgi:hypothetical protein
MAVDYETLHEKDEPFRAPWIESRIVSLADMMLGGEKICDQCGRWQRITIGNTQPPGWSKDSEKDLCPICTNGEQPSQRPSPSEEELPHDR